LTIHFSDAILFLTLREQLFNRIKRSNGAWQNVSFARLFIFSGKATGLGKTKVDRAPLLLWDRDTRAKRLQGRSALILAKIPAGHSVGSPNIKRKSGGFNQ